jgi:hypothetical protein
MKLPLFWLKCSSGDSAVRTVREMIGIERRLSLKAVIQKLRNVPAQKVAIGQ